MKFNVKKYSAVTLIEMLIVIAIMSIMVVGVGKVVSSTYRAAGPGQFEQVVFQQGRFVFDVFVHDIYRTEAVLESFGDYKTTTNTLILKLAESTNKTGPDIVILGEENSRIVRKSFRENPKKPHRQILCELPGKIEFKQNGNLVSVRLKINAERYNKKFLFDESSDFFIPLRRLR